MRCLVMLWTVRHRWTAGVRFLFNCYKHYAQLLLFQSGHPPVTLLSQEGVTKGYPLLVVLYVITLTPLAEDLRSADPGIISPFYADNAEFDGSDWRSARLMNILLEWGLDWGYLPDTTKSLFIV